MLVGAALAAAMGLAACGSSSSGGNANVGSGSSTGSTSSSSSAKPGSMFSTANVAGLGTVLVDGRGYTVYVLTNGHKKNLACTDANGCTQVWPDLPLPDGVSKAAAGAGVMASLLKAMKSSDGETYPTYNGYLMYEYASDTGPGQSNGEGIQSYGGTWYAISPAGTLVKSSSGSSGSSSSGGGSGGYGY
jgi:predicted lipoprotein with Yx(FWY)xxD motif